MLGKPQLPALKKSGDQVATTTTGIAGAIAGAVFNPVFAVASAALAAGINQLIKSRMEKSHEILIEVIRSGNLDVLSDEQYEAFIPMAYKFYRAAQEGESVSILTRYAKIIRSELQENQKPDQFLRFSRMIEGLSDRDLYLLDYYVNTTNKYLLNEGNDFNVPREVEEASLQNITDSKEEFQSISEILAGRGLLVGVKNVDMFGPNSQFKASKYAILLHNYCKEIQ
jgi:hypothetical protein